MASCYKKNNKNKKALESYSKAISVDGNYFLAYNNRSALNINLNNLEDALSDIEIAIKLDPNNASIYNNRGVIYHKRKKYEDAIMDFNKAIKIDENFTKAYLNRGITKQILRDEDGACNDWFYAKEKGLDLANKYLINDCQ